MARFLVHPISRFLILIGALAFTILGFGQTAGIKEKLSNLLFESYIQFKPRPASDQMVFVDIDDLSLAKIGQWPWPRTYMAEMIRNIAQSGAAVIIFDGVIAEPDRTSASSISALLDEDHPAQEALRVMPDHDTILGDAIAEAGNFVTGFTRGSNTKAPRLRFGIRAKRGVKNALLSQKGRESLYFNTTSQFLPVLQKNAAGNGSFIASADSDAVIRHTGLIFHNGKNLYPSLVVEGLRVLDNEKTITVDLHSDYVDEILTYPFDVVIGDRRIPMSADGKMWVYFRHFGADENVPAHHFIDPYYSTDKPDIDGKIVFIASSAEGLNDLRSTPLGFQPGVRVHMNAMEQILQETYLVRPMNAIDYEFFALVGAGLLIIGLSFFVNPIWLLLITAGFTLGGFGLSWGLFDQKGLLLDPVTPSIMLVFIFIVASALSFIKTEMEKRQVRDAFGLYISPDFMQELTDNPDKLKLGGEIRDLTIMFSDIRRFTSICEGLGPEETIQLINDFLTPMSDLVMDHRGTIDKYIGDAMMAFWNAPLDDADHARHACMAALGMQDALAPINEGLKARAKGSSKEPILLQAGIGINTGESAVGNMGSKQRFAYSTLGDAVNLAARLEGQTKTYGVRILIGESTWQDVQDFASIEIDLIQVVGKSQAVRIYALFGDETVAQDAAFMTQRAKHDEMLALYRERDFEGALAMLDQLKAEDTLDLGTTYSLYRERCAAFIKTPPPHNWDGVMVATSK